MWLLCLGWQIFIDCFGVWGAWLPLIREHCDSEVSHILHYHTFPQKRSFFTRGKFLVLQGILNQCSKSQNCVILLYFCTLTEIVTLKPQEVLHSFLSDDGTQEGWGVARRRYLGSWLQPGHSLHCTDESPRVGFSSTYVSWMFFCKAPCSDFAADWDNEIFLN